MITYHSLNRFAEIIHFCTTRQGGVSVGNYGSLNMSPFTGDKLANVIENQHLLCHKLGISRQQLIIPHQTHGTEIKEIDASFLLFSDNKKKQYLEGVDAVFTQLPLTCIGITTADCVPLLLFDPINKVVAAVHAGWRGTCARIASKTIKTLVERFGSNPKDIIATIGPSISVNVYEVGEDVVFHFEREEFDTSEIIELRNDKIHLDLWKANAQDLQKSGVMKSHIEIVARCTYAEHEKFFSARRLGIESGRLLSGIMLK